MKKTIIALLALAGVASADYTGDFTWSTESGYGFAFEGTETLKMTGITSSVGQKNINAKDINLGTEEEPKLVTGIGAASNYLEVTKLTSYAPDINIGNSLTDTWTLSFTLKNESDEDLTLSGMSFDVFLFNGDGNAQNADKYDRPITLTLAQNGVTIGSVEVATSGTNWHTTATVALQDYTLAANSTASLSLTTSNAQTDWNSEADGVQLRGTYVGLSGVTVNTASIPEPTTATLSLLALAGLAARRRRR